MYIKTRRKSTVFFNSLWRVNCSESDLKIYSLYYLSNLKLECMFCFFFLILEKLVRNFGLERHWQHIYFFKCPPNTKSYL